MINNIKCEYLDFCVGLLLSGNFEMNSIISIQSVMIISISDLSSWSYNKIIGVLFHGYIELTNFTAISINNS